MAKVRLADVLRGSFSRLLPPVTILLLSGLLIAGLGSPAHAGRKGGVWEHPARLSVAARRPERSGIGIRQEKQADQASDNKSRQTQEKAPARENAKSGQVRGFVSPSDYNVQIVSDVRSLVVMAAINMAGFDYETGGAPLSPARAELRKDLADMPSDLKARLAAFYSSHRRAGVSELSDALRYEALAMLMTEPPGFAVDTPPEKLPEDLRPLLGFSPLVREFYEKSGIKKVLPKYLKVVDVYDQAYRVPVGECIYDTMNYFHTAPDTIVHMKPMVIEGLTGAEKKEIARYRARTVFVVLDPLLPLGASLVRDDVLNQKDDMTFRRVGDDYTVVIGPSRRANTSGLRSALIRFALDPLIERHLKKALDYKEQILKLESALPGGGKLGNSVYLILRQSLIVAAETRLKQIESKDTGDGYTNDDAVFDLAEAYDNGAVLVFHFYNSLIGYEHVGIEIGDFMDQMLATTDWTKEAGRRAGFEPVVTRVREARARGASEGGSATGGNPVEVTPDITSQIVKSDEMIRQRRFADARPILEQVLASYPHNARALYGMAQVVNQTPSKAELDPNADENDKIEAQQKRLEKAIDLYRKAIEAANPMEEAWLVQWSHVLIGRILDFQEFRKDAIDEYEKAIAMGDITSGAYKEALQGKDHPFGQKQ